MILCFMIWSSSQFEGCFLKIHLVDPVGFGGGVAVAVARFAGAGSCSLGFAKIVGQHQGVSWFGQDGQGVHAVPTS
jgi:hypothetical protein